MNAGTRVAAARRDANIAEARRVIELAARHQLCLEFTADGWRMIPDVDLAALPPMADELQLVAS